MGCGHYSDAWCDACNERRNREHPHAGLCGVLIMVGLAIFTAIAVGLGY